MPPRRYGEGPTRMQDGAIMKITFTNKDRCYISTCSRRPRHIITYFDKQVWVCREDTARDGTC